MPSASELIVRRPDRIGGTLGRWLLRRLAGRMEYGSLLIETPAGERLRFCAPAPGPDAVVLLHKWRALRRLLLGGDVGFADSYIDGDWSSPGLTALIELAARNTAALDTPGAGAWPARMLHRLAHRLRANTRAGSRRNIVQHYDLGNDFYARWLDADMNYASALFTAPDQSLEDAQRAKQDRIVALLGLEGGERVLEIGCGWGGLAARLAGAHGCRVTGVTVSPAQLEYARARMAGSGVAADLRLQDYRDVTGTFDRVVSIEMLEAVGEAYWPRYFATLRRCLRPGGIAVLQVITIAEDRFPTYRRSADFIQRHVFPGGMLPSPGVLRAELGRAGLTLLSEETFGASYARTLAEWRRRFRRAWPDIAALGFTPAFRRMWDYYLCYCEAGFCAGTIDVGLYRIGRES